MKKEIYDGNYENTTIINEDGIVLKKYIREERFISEINGLNIIDRTIKCPSILDYKTNQLYLLMKYVKGRPIELNSDNYITILNLAKIIKKLHSKKLKGFGPFVTLNCYSGMYNTWNEYLTKRFYTRTKDIPITVFNVVDLEMWFQDNLKLLNCTKGSILHNDLKPANILVSNDEISLIDFDRCVIGDPISDIAKLFWRTFNRIENEKWFYFLQEYLQEFNPDIYNNIMKKVQFYDLLHCLGAISYYHFNPNGNYIPIYKNALDYLNNTIKHFG